MGTKITVVICIIVLSLIGGACFVHAQVDARDQATQADTDRTVYVGTSKDDLLKICGPGHIKTHEVNGNEEVFVFDDIKTATPGDTITFHLVDGKVKSWDKNNVAFPDNSDVRSAIYDGMTKDDLYKIYRPGNLQKYEKRGSQEILIFDDVFTSNPDDTVTFYFSDGRLKSWDVTETAITPEGRLKAIEERSRYIATPQSGSTYEDSQMRAKESARNTYIRSRGWYYRGGLYYR